MAQYIYTMNRVSKLVPPKREILKDISLSFFPGAKIGVLGLNGSGKSTLLRIMAGVDKDFSGEARAQAGIKIGYLEQEPELDPNKDVRGNVEDGVRECLDAMARLDEVFSGRTVVVVASRVTSVPHLDQIVVMDGGRTVERGKHADLIARGGLYSRLAEEQEGTEKEQVKRKDGQAEDSSPNARAAGEGA